MATLRPLGGRLVVKRIEQISKTASGLLIIDSLASRPNTAEVIAVGPDVKGVAVGDRVLYDAATGTELKVEGNKVFVLHENNLFGVIKSNMQPEALKHFILFEFLDSTGGSKGAFTERTKGSIYIPTVKTGQTTDNRWGKVLSVGPEVRGIQPGDYLLVAAQKWSAAEQFGDRKIWRTVDESDCVLAVTNDLNATYSF